jgi:N-acyl homoserine lactone hydrolase
LHQELRHSTERLRGAFSSSVIELPSGAELTARLTSVGVRPSDVTTLVLSHLHFDHCGGTAELPEARIVVQRQEWDAGHHPGLVAAGLYNPEDFDVGHDRLLIDGPHDVFGDGRVVCLPTPGHTKGHQSCG